MPSYITEESVPSFVPVLNEFDEFSFFFEKKIFSKNFLNKNHMDFVMVSGPEKMFLRHKQVMAIFMGFSCFLMGFSTSKKHSRARRAGIWGHKTPEDFVSSLSRHR